MAAQDIALRDNGTAAPDIALSSATFEASFMAALSWPWPVLVRSAPDVVPSGMTPPDFIPA